MHAGIVVLDVVAIFADLEPVRDALRLYLLRSPAAAAPTEPRRKLSVALGDRRSALRGLQNQRMAVQEPEGLAFHPSALLVRLFG